MVKQHVREAERELKKLGFYRLRRSAHQSFLFKHKSGATVRVYSSPNDPSISVKAVLVDARRQLLRKRGET